MGAFHTATHSTFPCVIDSFTLFPTHKTTQPPKFRENSTPVTTHPPPKQKALLVGTKVIRKVTFCFVPYPLFDWYPQSKEILLNLSMKCWNSALNAQGSIRE